MQYRHCIGSDSVPGPGTSTCHTHGQKQKQNKTNTKMKGEKYLAAKKPYDLNSSLEAEQLWFLDELIVWIN